MTTAATTARPLPTPFWTGLAAEGVCGGSELARRVFKNPAFKSGLTSKVAASKASHLPRANTCTSTLDGELIGELSAAGPQPPSYASTLPVSDATALAGRKPLIVACQLHRLCPPSQTTTVPLRNDASSDERYNAMLATSSGVPILPRAHIVVGLVVIALAVTTVVVVYRSKPPDRQLRQVGMGMVAFRPAGRPRVHDACHRERRAGMDPPHGGGHRLRNDARRDVLSAAPGEHAQSGTQPRAEMSLGSTWHPTWPTRSDDSSEGRRQERGFGNILHNKSNES